MKAITWGMIGCGEVTERKNGPGLYLAKNSVLKGVYNRTEKRAEDWVGRHGHGKVYKSAKELLGDPEIDIVYVATTPESHMEYALMCAAHHKHCYLEKPIAMDEEEGRIIQKAFMKSKMKVFVAHYRRGMDRFVKVKELLEGGAIGAVRGAYIIRTEQLRKEQMNRDMPWKYNPQKAGGGIFFEGEIHLLDLLDFYFGKCEKVNLLIDNQTGYCDFEDIVSMNCQSETGVMINGLFYYTAYDEVDRFSIIGDKGKISFSYSKDSIPIEVSTKDGKDVYFIKDEPCVGLPQIQNIVNELLGMGTCSATLERGLGSLKIASDAYKEFIIKQQRRKNK